MSGSQNREAYALMQKEFSENLQSYRRKEEAVSDREWLSALIVRRCPEISQEEAVREAEEIITSLEEHEERKRSLQDAAAKGISKEKWLETRFQEEAVGMSAACYGDVLKTLDDVLYKSNAELAEVLQRSEDGHIMVIDEPDGHIAEQETAQFQEEAQKSGRTPVQDGYYYSSKEYALSIGRNAGVMALQMAAVTTGFDIVSKICQGKEMDADELAETALRTGADAGIKVAASGTLYTGVRKGMVPFLPRNLAAGSVTNIVFVGVENAKILYRMAVGELSVRKGLDAMGSTMVSMTAGLWGMAGEKAALAGAVVLGGPLGVAAGFVGGMVGYAAGSSIGRKMYSTVKETARKAKDMAWRAFSKLKGMTISVLNKAGTVLNRIFA